MKTKSFITTVENIREEKEPEVQKFGGKVTLGNIADILDKNIVVNVKKY